MTEQNDLVPAKLSDEWQEWTIGPRMTTTDPERYQEWLSHPKCAEAPACPWRVWWQNGYMDDAYPPSLRKYCISCAGWHKSAQDDKVFNNGIVVASENGLVHYRYDANEPIKDPSRGIRGFGGRTFAVRFMDERGLVKTNDLWCGGEIPAHLLHLFKENAIFEEGV